MRNAFLGVVVMMLMASAALAQTGKHIAIGGAIGFTSYTDKDFSSKNPGFALAYRLNLKPDREDGWKWAAKGSVGYSKRKTTTVIGGTRTALGKLQTIPVEVGLQRSLRQGPWQVGIGIVAGPSFNHFDVDQAARDAYLSRLGTTLDGIKVKTSLEVKPEISAWYDVNKWIGVQGAVYYLFNRPKAETTSGGVTTSSTWKTDHASASLGVVVGIL